jgi:hypothetical protein
LINPILIKVKLTNLLRKRNRMKVWALLIKNNKIVLNSQIWTQGHSQWWTCRWDCKDYIKLI